MSWIDAVVVINLVMVICGPIGAYIAIKGSVANAGQIIQDRVRTALNDENELLRRRLARVERLLTLIVETLKKQHQIDLEIDGDTIILRDRNGSHVTRIKSDALKEE